MIEHVEGSDPARVRMEIPTFAFHELTRLVEKSMKSERARWNAFKSRGDRSNAYMAEVAYHATRELYAILMGRDPAGGEGGTP